MRLVSVLGDSVSTFEGYNPVGYSVFYNKEMQEKNGLTSVYDTWWAKVNQGLHAYLCVNNSYSGSKISGFGFPSASSDERLINLRTNDYFPDYILVYIGFNDFGQGVSLYEFQNSYEKMLRVINELNPHSKIYCGTLMITMIRGKDDWQFPEKFAGVPFDNYNDIIRQVCANGKCCLVDLNKLDVRYETIDGSHPTANGHQAIANAWLSFLLQTIEPDIETCIKMYDHNKNNDFAVYSVFDSLLEERVLLSVDENGREVALQRNNQTFLSMFTSQKQIPSDEPIKTKLVYLADVLNMIIGFGKQIIINPFSSESEQFFVPYPAIQKMLIPLMKNKGLLNQ